MQEVLPQVYSRLVSDVNRLPRTTALLTPVTSHSFLSLSDVVSRSPINEAERGDRDLVESLSKLSREPGRELTQCFAVSTVTRWG